MNLNDFVFDELNGIYVHKYSDIVKYSDGSEEYITDIFDNSNEIQAYPVELRKYIKDWPSRYHLSHVRTNLLESIQEIFKPESKVLELGGGMGAASLWLSEHFSSLDSIEGSISRARAIKLRTKNQDNIRVFNGDLSSIKFPESTYDLVTLIGVLEYIPFYESSVNPKKTSIQFLEKVASTLNDDGILMVAIENKLGAKFFSGCVEEHNGKLFSGIIDYPEKSAITYSRNELEEMAKTAGFENVQFYHVFPDYKLPKLFIREDPMFYEMKLSGLVRGLFEDYSGYREYFMPDSMLIESLMKAKLLHQFSNSFIMLCSKSKDVNLKTEWLAKNFWNAENTKPILHHTANFYYRDNKAVIERVPIQYGAPEVHLGNVTFKLNNENVIEGDSIVMEAYKCLLCKDNYDSFQLVLKEIHDKLINEYSVGQTDDKDYPYLRGESIDLCFWNLVRISDNSLVYFDRKWEWTDNLTIDFVLFRNLVYLYNNFSAFIREEKLSDFVIENIIRILPNYDINRFYENLEIESQFQSSILIDHVHLTDVETKIDQKAFTYKLEQIQQLKSIVNEQSLELKNTLIQVGEVVNQKKIISEDLLNTKCQLEKTENEKKDLFNELGQSTNERNKLNFDLNLIYTSGVWKLALKYYKVRDNVWPFKQFFKWMKIRNLKIRQGNINFKQLSQKKIEMKSQINVEIKNKEKKIMIDKYEKQDVMFFSVIDWSFRYQRPQHLASFMAEQGHRVFYFNANFNNSGIEMESTKENLNIVTLCNKEQSRVYDVHFDEILLMEVERIDKIITENYIKDCVVFIEYPTWQPIVEYIKGKYNFKIVFDYLDDFAGFNTNNSFLLGCNSRTFEVSDLVIASSKYLYEKAKTFNENVEIVRNGTEFEHFNKALKDNIIKDNKRPVIGYYGAIAEWFDIEKIVFLAEARPNWDFVLIGDFTYGNVDRLKELSNVKFLGEKNYQELPRFLKDFDVCTIPFKTDTELIKATNPVKFYEYLSAGKKIVATEIPELEEFKDKYVYLSNDNAIFLEYIEKCINNEDTLLSTDEMIQFAKTQDWQERGKSIEEIVKKRYGLVSIIIVTYNNLNYTKECINSIFKKTAYPNFEVVIVDNNSQDDTQKYLKELSKEKENVKIILNEENCGFAKGNNIGIKNSQGEYIILLNNDTVVTRGWVTNLIKHLDKDRQIGLIGPVTNSIGNEAKINVTYEDVKDMDWFAEDYTTGKFNELYNDINVLAMFCVCIRREILNEIGYLDERFGLGMFEDDDYSLRVKQNGYKVVCAEDVFIHHVGGASFKKIQSQEYQNIFNGNKKKFEDKWGNVWVPHKYRDGVS